MEGLEEAFGAVVDNSSDSEEAKVEARTEAFKEEVALAVVGRT